MSWKKFCDMCGAEIKGDSNKVMAVSDEYVRSFGPITSDDAMDACGECYASIRQAIEECKERGKHER